MTDQQKFEDIRDTFAPMMDRVESMQVDVDELRRMRDEQDALQCGLISRDMIIDGLRQRIAELEAKACEAIAIADSSILAVSESWRREVKKSNALAEKVRALEMFAPTIPEDVAKDAARYRWLRDPETNISLVIDKVVGESVRGLNDEFNGYDYEYRAGDELDKAIDAAMLAAAPKPKEKA